MRPNGSTTNRGGRNRTRNPRFWKPVLCQLSYTPNRKLPRKKIFAATFNSQSLWWSRQYQIPSHQGVNYSMILVTTPEPTVLPPSRIAKRTPSSIATVFCNSTSILTLSPGMHISAPIKFAVPVTSVVRKKN
jgi:hypothetical protein